MINTPLAAAVNMENFLMGNLTSHTDHASQTDRDTSDELKSQVTREWVEAAQSFIRGELEALDLVSVALKTHGAIIAAKARDTGEIASVNFSAPSGQTNRAVHTVLQSIQTEVPKAIEGDPLEGLKTGNLTDDDKKIASNAMFTDTVARVGLIPSLEVKAAFLRLCRALTTAASFDLGRDTLPLRDALVKKFSETFSPPSLK